MNKNVKQVIIGLILLVTLIQMVPKVTSKNFFEIENFDTFSGLIDLYEKNIEETNDCIILVKTSNGKIANIDIKSGQYYSTITITVIIINNCKTSQSLTNFRIGLNNLLINNKSSNLSNKFWIGESGPIWLNNNGVNYSSNFVYTDLSCQQCTGPYCDWALVPVGGKFIITFNGSLGSAINSKTTSLQSLQIGGKQYSEGTSTLNISIANLPQDITQNIPLNILDSNQNIVYTTNLTSNTSNLSITTLTPENTYTISVIGVGDSFKNIFYSPINITTPTLINDQVTTIQISFSKETTYNVSFEFSGYTSVNKCQINITSSNKQYLVSNGMIDGKTTLTLGFSFKDNFDISIISGDSNYTAVLSISKITNSVTKVSVTFVQSVSSKDIAGYFESWSAPWVSKGAQHALAKISSYVKIILVSFATPSNTYVKGSMSYSGTGLEFSSDFSVVKDAIIVAKTLGKNQKFILSVGGADYRWANISAANYDSIIALMTDLGLDGVDIDYENTPICKHVNTDALTCNTDQDIINIINNLKSRLPKGKLLTAATFSIAAYGTTLFPTTKYGPESEYSGFWVNPLKIAGNKLDGIFIMSYDASPTYKQTDGFNAYKSIFKGNIWLGLEVPPEAWGGYVLTVANATKFANYSINNGGNGVFIWSLQKKNGSISANTFLQPICSLYNLQNCDKPVIQP